MKRLSAARGFAIPDLLMLLVIATVVAALLRVGGERSKRLANLGESMANLKQFGSGLGSYAADHADGIFSFSYRGGLATPSTYPDLRGPFPDDLSAGAAQAVDIIRRRAGRTDMPVVSAWIAQVKYSHLVLADYLAASLPLRWAVSPEDKVLLQWSQDPAGFDQNQYPPQPAPGNGNQRWPYSSSYEIGPAFYSPDYAVGIAGTVSQGSTHNTFMIAGGTVLGTRRTTQIANPSQKAFMWDSAQRHLGNRVIFFASNEARVPICFADGGVRVRSTATANRGFNPASPQSLSPTTMSYQPLAWEPPLPSSSSSVQGVYRWTRNGLGGRDFDGDEVSVP